MCLMISLAHFVHNAEFNEKYTAAEAQLASMQHDLSALTDQKSKLERAAEVALADRRRVDAELKQQQQLLNQSMQVSTFASTLTLTLTYTCITQ